MPDGESRGICVCAGNVPRLKESRPGRDRRCQGVVLPGQSGSLLGMVSAMQTKTDISGWTKNRGRVHPGRERMMPYLMGDAYAYPSSTVMAGRVMMLHALLQASGFDELREVRGMVNI